MIFSFNYDYFFQGVSDELFKKIHFPNHQGFIDPPSVVEEVSRNQEQLHHRLSKSRQCLLGENGCKHHVPPKAEPCAGVGTLHLSAYLAQADGVVECLGPAVEVHGLCDVLLTLVLACQVIGSCPIPCFICYFSSLQRNCAALLHVHAPPRNENSGSRWK